MRGDEGDTASGGGPGFDGYAGRMLFSLSLAWFAVVTGRLLLPPFLPAIIADLDLTLATAGVALTVLEATSALVFYPSGRLSDRLGRATVIVPALVVFVAGLLLVAGAAGLLALLAAAVTLGVGNGLFNISARAAVSDHFTERRGLALGLFAVGFNVGGIVAAGVAAVVLARWRAPFVAVAAVLAAVTLLFVRWNREPYRLRRVEVAAVDAGRRLLGSRALRVPVLAYALFYVVTASFLGFFPTFLQEAKGVSPALASAGFALVFAVGILSKVVAGGLSDVVPRRLVALAGFVVAAAGLAALLVVDGVVALTLATVVFAVGHQGQFPLVDAILMDAVPAESLGGDVGAARTVFQLVGSLGPAYVGVVAELWGFGAAFGGLVVMLLAVAGLFAVVLEEPAGPPG